MATELLAVGTNTVKSADAVLAAGASISLKGDNQDSFVTVLLKDDVGGYNQVGNLKGGQRGMAVAANGTYAFQRQAGSSSCGVFSG